MTFSLLNQVQTLQVDFNLRYYSTILLANRAWRQASQVTSSCLSPVRPFSKLILSDLCNSTVFNRCTTSIDRKWLEWMRIAGRHLKACTPSSWMRSLSAHTYRRSIAPSSCANPATTSEVTRRWRTCANTKTSPITPKENVRIATWTSTISSV